MAQYTGLAEYARSGYDLFGGFSVYWQNELIANLYCNGFENGRGNYHVIRETITLEKFEKIFDQNTATDERFYLVDHLTGTIIPSKRHSIDVILTRGFHTLQFGIHTENTLRNLPTILVSTAILLGYMTFSCLRYPIYIKKAIKNAIDHYEKRTKKKFNISVKKHIATQRKVVIDLRRGVNFHHTNGNLYRINGTDIDNDYYGTTYCPLKKGFLDNIEEITLALPGRSESSYYYELLSFIDEGKVTELVVFNPNTLEKYLSYENTRRINLVDLEDIMEMDFLLRFRHLERVFISTKRNATEFNHFMQNNNKIEIEIAFVKECSTEIYRNY